MADVTGQFGQEDIVLNNAATEATLKQLLSAMNIVAAKSAKDFKSQKELEAALGDLAKKTKTAAANGKKFTQSTLRAYKAQEENTDSVEDNTKAYNNAVKAVSDFRDNARKASATIVGLINKVSSAADAVRGMDGSISGAVGALGNIPLGVGEVIKGVFGPVAGAVDQTHQAFMDAASAGANFGGNMRDLLKSSAGAGLSLSEFTGIIKNNSEALMFLGGSTDEGAKRLAKLGKDIRNTPLAADLARLGFSTADINEGFADYSKMLAKNGRLQGMSDAQLISGTHEYLKNLDAVSKLTGKSKESLQAEEDARQADAQYRVMMSKLDADGQKNMEALMKSIPAQHQAGLKEILATGTATSEAGVQALAFLKESGMSAQQLHQSMKQTGTLSMDQATQFNATYQKEATALSKMPLTETLGLFDPAANDFITGVFDAAARTKTLAEVIAENEAKLKTVAETPPPDIIDPATVQEFKQNINDKAIQMTEALASVNLEKLETVFNKAADIAIEYLPKAIEAAADNFELVAGSVALMNIAAIAATAALSGLSMAAGKGIMGQAAGSKAQTAKAGAAVQKIAGAGKSVLRKLPVVGAIAGVGLSIFDGVSSWNKATDDVEKGLITERQGTVEKGGAVGEAAGGIGGTLGGAAAGAAIGTAMFPVVGTAIGGAIGAAVGYWAGSKGGEAAGEAIGDAIAGPNTMKDLQNKIEEEQARINRSESGENEYWGSDKKGIAESKEKIAELQKQLKAQEKTAAEAGASSSTSTTATDAQKSLEQQKEEADKKAAEEAQKAKEEAAKKLEEAAGTGNTAAALQKSPEEVMLALNNNIEELVNLTRMSNALAQKHIGVTSGLTNDAFSV